MRSKSLKILIVIIVLVVAVLTLAVLSASRDEKQSAILNGGRTSQTQDKQRKSDVSAIWRAAMEYQQKNGTYPTNEVLNTPAVQSEYQLKDAALKDPTGSKAVLAAKPEKGVYSYVSTASDDSACSNANKPCAKFKVTAILSNGTEYSLTESQWN